MIEVALLGCGGGMPMPERYLSALLLNYSGRKILIDCGEGTQVSMRLLGWGFKTIDIICITHGHGDHIVGLPGLLSTIGNSGRVEPLAIIGPEGIGEIVKGLRVIAPYLPYEINIIENPRQTIGFALHENGLYPDEDAAEILLSCLLLDHSAPCLGYSFYIRRKPKFDRAKAESEGIPRKFWSGLQRNNTIEHEGKVYTPDMVLGEERKGIKVTLVTDTRPSSDIAKFVHKSNLLICEGTYGAEEDLSKAVKNKHMLFREAAELAREGEVDELLLTHFSPAMQEPMLYLENAQRVFPKVALGYDRITKQYNFEK